MFRNFTIKYQLLISFSMIVTLLIGVGLFTHYEMISLTEMTRKMYHHPLTVSKAVRDANIAIVTMQRDLRSILLMIDQMKNQAGYYPAPLCRN